jgi:repressor LexA
MQGLTRMQQRVFDLIRAHVDAGRPCPTHREVAAHFGFRSSRAAACHIAALKRKGLVTWAPGKARSVCITSFIGAHRKRVVQIPLFGSVPAGFADERVQEPDSVVSLDVGIAGFEPTQRTFALHVSGDSMIGKHICDGDIVILEHGAEPRPGQTVTALIDGKSTLKTFVLKKGKPFLRAENPKYPDLIPCEELMIQGVLRALIRKVLE